MASYSSASTNTSGSTNPLTLTTLHHLLTIKLTRDNYLLWKAQVVPYLKGLPLYGYMDGSITSPPQVITNQSNDG
jgi:hypothetical protein